MSSSLPPRRDTRTHRGKGEWVPDANDPARSSAEIAGRPATSGILIHQTGPDGKITQVPVLSFIPQPAHPNTGACWAEVMYFSGRTELPLAAVLSFTPDPTVREHWNTTFAPPPHGSLSALLGCTPPGVASAPLGSRRRYQYGVSRT